MSKMNAKQKTFDRINYIGIAALVCLLLCIIKYLPSRDECPRNGAIFYFLGSIGIIIFLIGKNISRMARKSVEGWKVALANILLTALLLTVCLGVALNLYFCLTF
jgi:hypothetical protein